MASPIANPKTAPKNCSSVAFMCVYYTLSNPHCKSPLPPPNIVLIEYSMSIFRCTQCGGMNRIGDAPKEGHPVCGRCKERLDTSGVPQEVNTAQMNAAVKKSPIPVLVDFWAPWCGPCRMVAPVLEAIAKKHAGKIMVLKLNSDENPEPSARYQVRGIPSLLLFKKGKEAARQTGALPAGPLEDWLLKSI